jgi:hypothetical protein
LVTAILIVLLCQAGIFAWLAKAVMEAQAAQAKTAQEQLLQAAAQENTRLVMLAESALEHMKAKSIEEKVRGEALRREYDIRLEMYRDAVAKEVTQKKAKDKQVRPEPQWATTDTGEKVDMNDVEWFGE